MFVKTMFDNANLSVFKTRSDRFLQPNAIKSVPKMQENIFLRTIFLKHFPGTYPWTLQKFPPSALGQPSTPNFVPPALCEICKLGGTVLGASVLHMRTTDWTQCYCDEIVRDMSFSLISKRLSNKASYKTFSMKETGTLTAYYKHVITCLKSKCFFLSELYT